MEQIELPAVMILVGPKHSGKTSTGKALAKIISGTFIDLDDEIGRSTGKSPRQLFREGERVFRTAEFQAVQNLLRTINLNLDIKKHDHYVIAAGGGIVDNPEAIKSLKNNGVIINLELSPKKAWDRIKASAKKTGDLPPFLQTDDPVATHRMIHERREKAYRDLADLTIDAELEPPELRAQEIVRLLYHKTA